VFGADSVEGFEAVLGLLDFGTEGEGRGVVPLAAGSPGSCSLE